MKWAMSWGDVMFGRLAKAALLVSLLIGLCLPARAITTTPDTNAEASDAVSVTPAAFIPSDAIRLADDAAIPKRQPSIALLLPTRSEALRAAAEAVRAGFQAGYEREYDTIAINIIETGDAPQDILAGYRTASAQSDIVVGPLSRSGVAAIVQAGVIDKPTIALTPPDNAGTSDSASPPAGLPPQLLVMGLSIEDEARQVANWASGEHPHAKALVIFTKTAWQRRAGKAFALQWQQQGLEAEMIELPSNDGFLNGRMLLQLKKQMQNDTPMVLFLALDAVQARQVRSLMGKQVVQYGTSQLNPFVPSATVSADRMSELDGTRLLDIPWQLQPDHPAVMIYPRLVVEADRKPDADLERLYALGIDAYRVAREIAAQHTRFDLDGVTGKLSVRIDKEGAHFARSAQQAVYRDGGVTPTEDVR